MKTKEPSRLFSSANWVMMLAIVGALLAAQWKHEAVPLAVITTILVLTVVKARLIILDFMDLRGEHPALAAALWAWPVFFSLATLGRALGSHWAG
jgi:nitric oxide reductase NorF protein